MHIHIVARLPIVSMATVSRTINHFPTVNPKMAKRVWQVIGDSDYLSDTQGRALASGRSRHLGSIVSGITNPFFPELWGIDVWFHSANQREDYSHEPPVAGEFSCIRRRQCVVMQGSHEMLPVIMNSGKPWR
jgi:hypothetical protein